MSELAKRLASKCWPAVLSDLEGRKGILDGVDDDVMVELEHGVTEAVYCALANELDAMALEEATNDPEEMDRDLSDPEVAYNYVLSLSKEVVSKTHTINVLRALCKKHEGELAMHLDRQAAMHAAEVAECRSRIDELENHILEMGEHDQ